MLEDCIIAINNFILDEKMSADSLIFALFALYTTASIRYQVTKNISEIKSALMNTK